MSQMLSYLYVLQKRPENEQFVKIRRKIYNLPQIKLILAKKKKKGGVKTNKIIYGIDQKNETDGLGWFS